MSAIFAVHRVLPEEVCATEYLTTDQAEAEEYASAVSGDEGTLAGAVTRYVLGEPGRRTATALFVRGERQSVPWISDDRTTWANAVKQQLR